MGWSLRQGRLDLKRMESSTALLTEAEAVVPLVGGAVHIERGGRDFEMV